MYNSLDLFPVFNKIEIICILLTQRLTERLQSQVADVFLLSLGKFIYKLYIAFIVCVVQHFPDFVYEKNTEFK